MAKSGGPAAHKVTTCACSKDGGHYSETMMESIFPGTPDRIHNLMFASGFIKDFLAVDQKLLGGFFLFFPLFFFCDGSS